MKQVQVSVILPSLLAHCTSGQRTVSVKASNLQESLERLMGNYPLLRKHLLEEGGDLREHVNVFYNGDSIRWMEDWTVPLEEGSTLLVIQAVSGG